MKQVLCLLFLLFLGGCVEPLLSPEAQRTLCQVNIENIPERQGQILRQRLINAFNAMKCCPKKYNLHIRLTEDNYGMGIGIDSRTTISHLATTARYKLTRKRNGHVIAEGSVAAQNSYDILNPKTTISLGNTYYSTTTSEDFARRTNTDQLVSMITLEIARVLSQKDMGSAHDEGFFFEADKVP